MMMMMKLRFDTILNCYQLWILSVDTAAQCSYSCLTKLTHNRYSTTYISLTKQCITTASNRPREPERFRLFNLFLQWSRKTNVKSPANRWRLDDRSILLEERLLRTTRASNIRVRRCCWPVKPQRPPPSSRAETGP